MSNIEKYISDGVVQRSKIALDVADGSISTFEIREICADQRVKQVYIGTSYDKKCSKEAWNDTYLDQVICASVAESFNQDYLLYLSEVGEYIRSKKPGKNRKMVIGVIAVVSIIAVIIGVVVWKNMSNGSELKGRTGMKSHSLEVRLEHTKFVVRNK